VAVVTRSSEDDLIARHFAPLAAPGALRLQDDAACFSPKLGHDLVLTVDAVVAGVHFLADDPPESVARKALGVNLSDLAAKGAEPTGFLLTLGLPDDWSEPWLAGFAAGLGAAAAESGCGLLGGDTVRAAGALSLSITAVGQVPFGQMVRRTTAQPGDRICVSGTIGDAVLGLALLTGSPGWAAALSEEGRAHGIDRYRHPRPRLGLTSALRAHASAAMDVSDGLVGDLAKMMRASGVGASVDLGAVPYSDAARAGIAADPALRDRLVTGGDDYEILACVPEERLAAFVAEAGRSGIPVTVIGEVLAGEGSAFHEAGVGHSFASGSFSHF
jgi:thiamine-monophosphate kinase